jgi:hypothetical protein
MLVDVSASGRHSPRLVMLIQPREDDTFTHRAMLVVNGPGVLFLLSHVHLIRSDKYSRY